jgi:glycosyltransferase involved in cell wall biosynthesis
MRIHLYLKNFRPNERPEGGMEKAVAGLAGGIVASGGEAVVLCEGDADQTVKAPDGYLVRCFHNDYKRKHITIARGLRHYVESEMNSTSLVILNAIFHPSVARFAHLLRRHRVPYIIAPHDPYHDSIFLKNAKVKWPYWYLIERPMLRHAAAVQVLDKRHGELLRQRGVNTPIIEVINGYRESDVSQTEQLPTPANATARFLFLGRMEAINKGLDLLIDAFNQVAQNAPNTADIDLTLQGPDGGDLTTLKAQAAATKSAAKIHFLPPDFKTSPAKIASAFDVVVIPSRFEGFSLAAMEAMLAARPVIISDIAGLAPHVRSASAGIVVDATIPSIRDGLQEMLRRRADWPTMGLAGRTYALDRFRWPRIAAEAMAEYKKFTH